MKKVNLGHIREYMNLGSYKLTSDGFKYLTENQEVFIKGFKKGCPDKPDKIPAYIENMPVVYLAGLHNLPLAGEVKIPDTVRELEWAVFNIQEAATKFILPESLIRIDEYAFSWCKALEEISFPDSITELGLGTVMSCKKLKSVRLPVHLKEIPAYFASGCSALEEIIIPESVKKINEMAFNDCSNLKCIHLPAHLECIEKYAFAGCSHLEYPVIPENCIVHGKAFCS